MAWDEYMLVRDSDLYDGRGLAKPVLTLIAMLIIGAPAEGQEPDEDEGWCVATQDYLAMALGCSDDEVSLMVNQFKRDGWLEIKEFRDNHGHKRNNYRLL